ncbi:MAG: AhpC/TSA family [Acidobacteriota bacterium]|nr:AhpC/TSA family [Acidobacteriota bacterium]
MDSDSSGKNPLPVKLSTVALWLLLIALTISNLLLLRQNMKMRAALTPPKLETLHAGDRVQPFMAEDLRGGKIDVSYNGTGAKRVLLYFTPTCPFCRQQFAYWHEVFVRADRERFEVLGVVSDKEDKEKMEDYLRQFGCAADSQTPLRAALVPDDVRCNYKLMATPITLIVNNNGTVDKAWSGRWSGEEMAKAGETFGVSFSVAAR